MPKDKKLRDILIKAMKDNSSSTGIVFIPKAVDQAISDIQKWHKEQCKSCKRLDITKQGHDVDKFYKK